MTKVERCELGCTGAEISVLGFGAATLGGEYGPSDKVEGERAVRAAIDAGVTYFDVAPYYGRTLAEERLGEALTGLRDKVFLSSKCARFGLERFDFSGPRVASSVDESLQRLRTDHLDLLIVHDVEFGDERQVVEETIPAALAMKETGKVRFVGISGLPVRFLRKVAEQIEIDAILSYAHYTLLNNELDLVLGDFCKERGIGLINASPLSLGLLTEPGPQDWHRAPDEVKAVRPRLLDLCRARGKDIAQVALRFALDCPRVQSTLVGIKSVAELENNIKALFQESDADLLAEIRELVAPVRNLTWREGRPENNV
ncbi:MAG: aldo/keto reductase [Planctomycetes bacterium]|nr:aldo/keto reductase [Planctomycetota bacterium]